MQRLLVHYLERNISLVQSGLEKVQTKFASERKLVSGVDIDDKLEPAIKFIGSRAVCCGYLRSKDSIK